MTYLDVFLNIDILFGNIYRKMVRWLAFCCPGFVGQYRFRPMVNFTDEQLSTLLTSANQNSSNCHICNG
ncbi:hypothetical protein T4E_8166 [Trichinella pseudospiralis]|uniref:Uncharacterized protein n=1 Tax=Trichinella pseudospiralis TaxID=6337 RepID=A0A0V0YE99_TRIPS|nr:hypothetical protein T4E_8166 [Trichinella pseudospiralis]